MKKQLTTLQNCWMMQLSRHFLFQRWRLKNACTHPASVFLLQTTKNRRYNWCKLWPTHFRLYQPTCMHHTPLRSILAWIPSVQVFDFSQWREHRDRRRYYVHLSTMFGWVGIFLCAQDIIIWLWVEVSQVPDTCSLDKENVCLPVLFRGRRQCW